MSQRFTNNDARTAASWSFDTSQNFSACGWLYIVSSTAGDGDVFFTVPAPGDPSINSIRLGYSHNGSSPTARFRVGNGSIALNVTSVISAGQWYHLTVTYDGTTARAYLDGVSVGSQVLAMSATHASHDTGDFSGGTATAEYAYVKAWLGHCLSAPEIAAERASAAPVTDPGNLYAFWKYANTSPTLDSSGNSHTLSGAGTEDGAFEPPVALTAAATLTTGSTLTAASQVLVLSTVTLFTSTRLPLVVNMTVAGSLQIRTGSQLSATPTAPVLLPIWRADSGNLGAYEAHSPWISESRDVS